MTECQCVNEGTDPPKGGKGCSKTMRLHNPVLNKGRSEDKHSRTMRPSLNPPLSSYPLKICLPTIQYLAQVNSPPGTSVEPLWNNTAPLLKATSVSYGSDTTLLGPY